MSEAYVFVLDCERSPTSIRVARDTVVRWVNYVGADPIADVAKLLVSELATNAVLHVGQPYTIRAHWRPPLFHVDVVDADPSQVARVRVTDRPGPGGRGLKLVERLSRDWGVFAQRDRKTVWFDLEHWYQTKSPVR